MNSPRASGAHFLGCDWGTTSFRLRLVSREDLRIVATVTAEEGAKTVHSRLVEQDRAADPDARHQAFSAVLSDALARLAEQHPNACAGAPVIVSGMASSTVGWRELPYARTPCPLDASTLTVAELPPLLRDGSLHSVWMVSGLTTGTDILRGEETEAIGLLNNPAFAPLRAGCRLVLPGTHSKHLVIRDGAILDFHTHMTGELLELLSTRSLLAASVNWPPPPFGEGDSAGEADFRAGVAAARAHGLGRGLFQVRVRSVLDRVPSAANARYLSGLLIGAELLDLLGGRPTGRILLAASAHFGPPYRLAFEALGIGRRLRVASPAQVANAAVAAHALLLDRLTGSR